MDAIIIKIKVKIKFSLCIINYTSCHKNVWGSKSTAPCILTPMEESGKIHARAPFHSRG
jgi:hypothetical protein